MDGAYRLGEPVGAAVRPLGLAIAVAGLVAAGATALSLRGKFVDAQPENVQVQVEPEQPALRQLQPVPERVRPVASDRVAPPPVAQEALERIDDREPLSPIGRAQVPSERPPGPTILHRPLAVAAGIFHSQGHTVALAGVEAPDAKEECVSDGVSWPCGVHARTAFRNWLRGRALTCVVPAVPVRDIVVSDCTLGRQNPAEWLVAYGWARAAPDGPYAALEVSARDERRGLFGPAPDLPEPLSITVPELSNSDLPAPFLLETDVAPVSGPSGG